MRSKENLIDQQFFCKLWKRQKEWTALESWAIQHKNIGELGHFSIRALESWDTSALEHWRAGALQH
jgi:hypothetical protein